MKNEFKKKSLAEKIAKTFRVLFTDYYRGMGVGKPVFSDRMRALHLLWCAPK